jgi:hypothetical protein
MQTSKHAAHDHAPRNSTKSASKEPEIFPNLNATSVLLQVPDNIPPVVRPLQRARIKNPPIALPHVKSTFLGIQELLAEDFDCLCRRAMVATFGLHTLE